MCDPEPTDFYGQEVSLIRMTKYVDGEEEKDSFWNGREGCLDATTHEVIKSQLFMLSMFIVFNHLSF